MQSTIRAAASAADRVLSKLLQFGDVEACVGLTGHDAVDRGVGEGGLVGALVEVAAVDRGFDVVEQACRWR